MKIQDLDFLKLIPEFMSNDDAVKVFAEVLNEVTHKISLKFESLSTWSHIDILTETELDELAWELNIDWYNKSASIDVKREIVKNSDLIHARRGTKWAVEQLVKSYFGSGKVKEWFEYDGNPYRFKVFTSNSEITDKLTTEFIKAVEKSKNVRSWLDAVVIELGSNLTLNTGIAYHIVSTERYVVGGEII